MDVLDTLEALYKQIETKQENNIWLSNVQIGSINLMILYINVKITKKFPHLKYQTDKFYNKVKLIFSHYA